MRTIRTSDSKENLCNTCPIKSRFPECMTDIEFGNDAGNDNIVACSNCASSYSKTIYPDELKR